ncbi:zeta toxin family protein [Emticicia agri]|uniref:Zeta toxin n=1 Tax=Emticicia agri TaxID=2492393 RepID=A0A4Q5M2R0_9BACT|nr:zeta toxin family protein [Emticicia agri]RYU96646.1 zeta toxin [Emticicia agri]
MPQLYIIAGCNGAGKTTASYTILPEMLNCREFVNADNIAAGLSPFNPESVAIEAGRIMLQRIHTLMAENLTFAFETTLATKSYVSLVKQAKAEGYEVTLAFFWLPSPKVVQKRVLKRVRNGGHNIPAETIKRRYFRGIQNLFKLYLLIVDNGLIVNNYDIQPELIAQKLNNEDLEIINSDFWSLLNKQKDEIY